MDDYEHDRKEHWRATQDPQVQERQREIGDRLTVSECVVEEEMTATPEFPPSFSDAQVKKQAGLSDGEWVFIKRITEFRRRFYIGNGTWWSWTVPVLQQCAPYLLKSYRSPAAIKKAAQGVGRVYTAKQKAAVSEGLKASWARRKATGGDASYGLRKLGP